MKFLYRWAATSVLWGLAQASLTLVALQFAIVGTGAYSLSLASPTFGGRDTIFAFFIIMGILVFGVSFVAGYALSDYSSMGTALLLSQLVTGGLFVASTKVFPYIVPPLPDKFSVELFFALSSILSFFLAALAGISGSFFADRFLGLERPRKHTTISLDKHRATLLAMVLVMLFLGTSLAVQTQMTDLNKTLNLQNVVSVVRDHKVTLDAGVQNTSVNFGPVPKGSGYLMVGWGTTPLSFNVVILDAHISVTNKNSPLGTAYIPFTNSNSSAIFKAWFHNDACSSTGCPAESDIYSIWIVY